MDIPNKEELQEISLNHSSDNNFKDFIKIYKNCTVEPYTFFVDNPLRFRKNLFNI